MAISTNKQQTSALAQLSDLEDAHTEAADRATDLTREYTAKNRRLQGWTDEPGLLDLLRRLQHREPDQFAADGTPRGPEATKLQKEIDAVGDPQALVPEIDQAVRLQARRKQDVDAFIPDHIDTICEGLRPDGAALAASANGKLQEAASELKAYIGFVGRASSLTAAGGREPRTVRGLDEAAELLRHLERVDLPSPLGEHA